MTMLTKSKLLISAQCSRRLWLLVNHPELQEEDPNSAIKIKAGNEVGVLARSLYPDGILINTLNKSEALTLTKEIMAKQSNQPIFEAAFEANDVLVRVDLLIPEKEGYRLVEVKGSSSEKPYYLEDIAVQTWVMRKAGINPTKSCLSYINNGFVYQGNNQYKDFFAEVDLTNKIEHPIPSVFIMPLNI
jgi:predicted RecB family nuclease